MSENLEHGAAYQGAREDFSIWKRRALKAEAKVREQDQIIERLGDALNADNGPTFMGEPKLIDTLHKNGDLIAAQATIAHQAQMIEHLRGGLTTPTTIDVANADADGFKSGRKSVGLLLGKGFNTLQRSGEKYSITLAFQNADYAYAAFTEIATVVRLSKESGHG